jgi:hypothetical protein
VQGAATSVCPAQPNSLLAPTKYNCNIYGNNGLPAIQSDSSGGQSGYDYCVPDFTNGTGQFTPQVGLIAIVQTDSSGNFKDKFTACGIGQNRVIARYYGNPSPEPIIVNQTDLAESGSVTEFADNIYASNTVAAQEYNYSEAPNFTVQSFEIGSYALNLGAINVIELLVVIAVIVAILLKGFTESKDRKGDGK